MKRKTIKKSIAFILSLILTMSVIVLNGSSVFGEDYIFEVITDHPDNRVKYNVTIPDLHQVLSVENILDKNNTYVDFKCTENPGKGTTVEGWVYGTGPDNSKIVEYIKDGQNAGKFKFKLKITYVKNAAPVLKITSPSNSKRYIDFVNVQGTVNDINKEETVKLYYLIDKAEAVQNSPTATPGTVTSTNSASANTPTPTPTPIPKILSDKKNIDHQFTTVPNGSEKPFDCYVPIGDLDDGTYLLRIWAEDSIHKFPNCQEKTLTFTKDTKNPKSPEIKISPSDKSTKKVTVNIIKPSEPSYKTLRLVYKKIKATENEEDIDYQDFNGSFEVNENLTVIAVCYDMIDGQIMFRSQAREYKIENIDNTKPSPPTINLKDDISVVTDKPIKFTITHGIDDHKDAPVTSWYNYNGAWIKYNDKDSVSGVIIDKPGTFTLKAKTVDQAGNESEVVEKKVTIKSTTPTTSTPPNVISAPGNYVPAAPPAEAATSAATATPTTAGTPTATPIPIPADLGVFLTSSKTAYEENGTVTFSVYYNNKLDTPAENVIVKVEIPQNATVVDAANGTVSGNTISWNIGTLNPKSTGEKSFKIKLGTADSSESKMSSKVTISSANILNNTDDDESVFNFIGFSGKIEGKSHVKFINGYETKEFKPENVVTRAEVAKILVTALSLGKSTDAGKKFSDVDKKHWAYDYIITAVNNGLFSGYSDGTFLPNKAITRAELSTALAKYLKLKNIEPYKLHFNDISKHWAKNYIEEIFRSRLIEGYSDGSFKPDAQIKRGECVTIIDRLLNRGPLKDADCGFIDVNKSHWAYGYIAEGSIDHNYTRNSDGSETNKSK